MRKSHPQGQRRSWIEHVVIVSQRNESWAPRRWLRGSSAVGNGCTRREHSGRGGRPFPRWATTCTPRAPGGPPTPRGTRGALLEDQVPTWPGLVIAALVALITACAVLHRSTTGPCTRRSPAPRWCRSRGRWSGWARRGERGRQVLLRVGLRHRPAARPEQVLNMSRRPWRRLGDADLGYAAAAGPRARGRRGPDWAADLARGSVRPRHVRRRRLSRRAGGGRDQGGRRTDLRVLGGLRPLGVVACRPAGPGPSRRRRRPSLALIGSCRATMPSTST